MPTPHGCVQRAGATGCVVMDGAFGARRLIVNRVLNEVECEPLDVEGQRPIGLLEDTTRLGYIEAYFDHPRWGEEALGVLAAGGRAARSRAGRRQPAPRRGACAARVTG